MLEMILSAFSFVGIIFLIWGGIKDFKQISWQLKLGILFVLIGQATFVFSFFSGFFQGLLNG